MPVNLATQREFSYIHSLSKKHAEELGFIPTSAMQSYLDRGRIRFATENGDPCGYFLTGRTDRSVCRIFQACVQLDARGLNHGLELLSSLIADAVQHGARTLSLHCRDGLESNGFWSACGFTSGGLLLGGKARRKIIHQWELDIPAALASPVLPYKQHLLATLWPRTQKSPEAYPQPNPSSVGVLQQYLDPEESNVTHAEGSLADPHTFALEALRTLRLAAPRP